MAVASLKRIMYKGVELEVPTDVKAGEIERIYKEKMAQNPTSPQPKNDARATPETKSTAQTATPTEADKQQRYKLSSPSNAKMTATPKGTPAVDEYIASLRETGRKEAIDKGIEQRRAKQKGYGKLGKVSMAGIGGAILDGALTYAGERAEDPNGSKAIDALKAGGTAAAWLLAEPLMWGITVGQGVVALGSLMKEDAEENINRKRQIETHVRTDATGMKGGTIGGGFEDTEYAATSRQRQEQIMRQHRISSESILGSEARQLHR